MAYTIQISLKYEEYQRLSEKSEELKIPKSRLLANAFNEWVERQEQEKIDRSEL